MVSRARIRNLCVVVDVVFAGTFSYRSSITHGLSKSSIRIPFFGLGADVVTGMA